MKTKRIKLSGMLFVCGLMAGLLQKAGAADAFISFPFDTDPGWSTQGLWEFGVPLGNAGDPTYGYTGTNVYGYNLAGGFPTFNAPHLLTTPLLDCSDHVNVKLNFWRWLTHADGPPPYTMAAILVKNASTDWQMVWSSSEELIDTEWTEITIDISNIADRQTGVQVSWAMGTHNDMPSAWGGWNIDDVSLVGDPADALGVDPEIGWDATAYEGSLPAQSNVVYTVTNLSDSVSLDWMATSTQGWLTISPTNGTLPPNTSTNLVAAIDSIGLAPGNYSASFHVENVGTTNAETRLVNLEVLAVPGTIDISPAAGFSVTNLIGQQQSMNLVISNAAAYGYVDFNLELQQTGYAPPAEPEPMVMRAPMAMMEAQDLIVEEFSFAVPGFVLEDGYDHASIVGLEKHLRTGAPVVPVKPATIELPSDRGVVDVRIEILAEEELPGTYMLPPAQALTFPGDEAAPGITPPDPAVYGNDANWPGIAGENTGIYEKRGTHLINVNLFPLQFNPVRGTLTHATRMRVVVELDGGRPAFKAMALEATASSLPPGGPFKHVIITSPSFAAAPDPWNFQALRDKRTAEGLPSTIITTDWIYSTYEGTRPDGGTDNPTKIRNFLIDAYENWGLEYVLLGGGINAVPSRFFRVDHLRDDEADVVPRIDEFPVDMYYACLAPTNCTFDDNADGYYGEPNDGVGGGEVDLFAEVYVGRAPVESVAELANFVKKTLKYADSSDPYLQKVSMAGEYLDYGIHSYAKPMLEQNRLGGTYDGFFTRSFGNHTRGDVPELDISNNLYDADSTWSKTDFANLVNSGVHIVNGLGHANETRLFKMNVSDIPMFTNTLYCFMYSQACENGAFDSNDCWAEEAIAMPYGPFAAVMNVRFGWGEPNTTYCPSNRFNREFWNAVFAGGKMELGKANQYGKEALAWDINGPAMRWSYYELTLFGDPAQRLNFPYEPDWLTADPMSSSGILPSNRVDVAVNFNASGIAAGSYTGEITVASNDTGNPEQVVPAVMVVLSDDLAIAPEWGGELVGDQGALPVPYDLFYSLTNSGSAPLDWSATDTAVWLDISPSNGTLAAYAQTNLTLTINAAANTYPTGLYSTVVSFSNVTSGAVFTRAVQLSIEGGTTNDITAPSCMITRDDANPTAASNVNFSVDFSEAVFGFELADVDLTGNAPGMGITGFSGSGSNYTVTVGGILGSGNVSIDVDAGRCTDAAGNSNTVGAAVGYQIDQVAPVIISITSSASNGTYGAGAAIGITLNFSEPVTLAGSNLVVTLETGAADRDVLIGPVAGVSQVSGVYTVQAGDVAADLSVTNISLNDATLRDAVGNNANLGIPVGENLHDNADIAVDTTHVITSGKSGNGTITPEGAVAVEHNGTTNFLIQAAANHHIAGITTNGIHLVGSPYSGNGLSNTNVVWSNVIANGTITAAFEINRHMLSVVSAYGGVEPGSITADWGAVINQVVTNSPVSGGVGTQQVCVAGTVLGNAYTLVSPTNVTLTLTNNATLNWQWQTQYALQTSTNGHGDVTAADGWYASGSNVVLTAAAADHWHFSHWSGDTNGCGIADNVITASMTQARSISAVFAIDAHTLTVVSAYGGTDPGSETADWGTALSQFVTNSPVSGGVGTQQVCVAGTVLGNNYTLVSPTNISLTLTNDAVLTWQWQTQYALATGTNGSGSVTAADGFHDAGSNVVLTATPAENWHFSHWVGDTNGCGIADNVVTAVMTQARSIVANFEVDPPDRTPFASFTFDTDPGWIVSGDWAFGVPQGLEGDPTSGYTGTNVYGYNLAGAYGNNLLEQRLRTSAIDCSGYTNVSLTFMRWLGIEASSNDHARIEVCIDSSPLWGSTWHAVWAHDGPTMTNAAWEEVTYDISAIVDGQPTVYIRWVMGATDSTNTFCGWNIDDVVLAGVPLPADADGNGIPDWWELEYFSSNVSASADGDVDGYDNMAEFIAGTDPTNANSFFMVHGHGEMEGGTNRFVLEWIPLEGRLYDVQWSSNLFSGFQLLEGGLPYPQGTYTDATHNAAEKFYKLDVRME
jgi:hypothetical protein